MKRHWWRYNRWNILPSSILKFQLVLIEYLSSLVCDQILLGRQTTIVKYLGSCYNTVEHWLLKHNNNSFISWYKRELKPYLNTLYKLNTNLEMVLTNTGMRLANDTTCKTAGARLSKVPKTFRARKAIRKTTTRSFCKPGHFICCKGNKNWNRYKVSCFETLWRRKENYVTRNAQEKSRDFRETGPWP